MRVISWNINGIRAIEKKGFGAWLAKTNADIVCLQEIKANEDQIPESIKKPKNYFIYTNSATKKGYSGVLVYTKEKPLKIEDKLGLGRFDDEGRILKLHFKDLILINVYIPHGDRTKKNLPYKLEAYDHLLKYLNKNKNKNVILMGDLNIAHNEIDLSRPKDNTKNVMFTPEERKQIDRLEEIGYIDTFRSLNSNTQKFTWWPYFANARERDLGWRIDYAFISKSMKKNLKKAFILTKDVGSDHCPIGIEIK